MFDDDLNTDFVVWIKSKICKETFDYRNLVKTGMMAYNKKRKERFYAV